MNRDHQTTASRHGSASRPRAACVATVLAIAAGMCLTACGDPGPGGSGAADPDPSGANRDAPASTSSREPAQAPDETAATPTPAETSPGASATPPPSSSETGKAQDSADVVTIDGGTATVELTGNDQMQYNANRFEVPADATITLELEHIGKLPKNAMGHNVVILEQDVDVAAYNAAAAPAMQNDYLPPGRMDDVIAHTDLIGGGQSTSVTFPAPAPGAYDYLCTFPGHYQAGMKGRMIVVE